MPRITVPPLSLGSAKTLVVAAALSGVLLVALEAQAATFIFKTSNEADQYNPGPALLDLGEGNGTSFTIHARAASRVAIFFNAACSTNMREPGDWVDVDILVDGAVISPSSGNNALCSSTNELAIFSPGVGASSDAVTDVAAGPHTIQVRVALVGALSTDLVRIDGLSLIVILDEL